MVYRDSHFRLELLWSIPLSFQRFSSAEGIFTRFCRWKTMGDSFHRSRNGLCPPGRFNMGSPVSELGRNEDELERGNYFHPRVFHRKV